MENLIIILIIVVGPFVTAWILSRLIVVIILDVKLIIRLVKVIKANKHGLLGKKLDQ